MHRLLDFANELERRDSVVASALADVETLQAEVERIRLEAGAALRFLATFPLAAAEREGEEQAARAARDVAAGALRAAEQRAAEAKKDADHVAAERVRVQAAEELERAERRLAAAESARAALAGEADSRRAEAERLHERAVALAPRVRGVPPPAGGGDGAHQWASQARGALLLERSKLAQERDAVVREASELVASVTGEPLTSTAVAGIRERLARALARPAP